MFKKKLIIILTIFFLIGCEYKPIYSSSNKSNYEIIITEVTGDKKLNKFIVENLIRNSQTNSNKVVKIKIDTQYTKVILAKDTAGNITDYQASGITTFSINRNETKKTFTINEKFNFQKLSDKYEEKGYEENIKMNLAIAIAQKLILRLSIAQ